MTIDPVTLTANWTYPTAVRFGPGRIAELPQICRELGISEPMLVTDPGLVGLPMIRNALAANAVAGVPTAAFSDIKPNPVGKNVDDGVAAYRAGNHDGVIAIGGGSALDAAKAIAFMAGQKRPIWDFEDIGDNWKQANPAGIAPIIAVPTTAGTGSEVGRAAVILQEETKIKRIIFHPKMMPSMVVSDPSLTLGLPPHITAATGMDALAHCLEAYCAPGFHPMAEGIAVEGLRLIREWLPKAVADGSDIAARAHMLAAASMGATAFQKGLGAIHSLSHPIGSLYDTHHGLTNAVVMPYVMAHNRPAIETKMARLAAWLGLPHTSFDGILDWVVDLRATLSIPNTLAELGVAEESLDHIAKMAAVDPTAATNPMPLDVRALRSIAANALEGRIG